MYGIGALMMHFNAACGVYRHCENRWMDEHMVVQGEMAHVDADINLNNVTWWTDKHNHCASREALDLLIQESRKSVDRISASLNKQAHIKRWIKQKVYARMPMGLRAFLYFCYRYFLQLGFLDGWQG
jgi:hypothetical protein